MKKALSIVLALIVIALIATATYFFSTTQSTQEQQTPAPFYLSTMTHMEGGWTMAATDEAFFNSQATKLRHIMDLAEEHGVILTFETELPFAQGMQRFNDNVFAEAVERGHGVGTHCDIFPRKQLSNAQMTQELRKRKDIVDELVGADQNKGCSGAGGVSNWYKGAVQAGFGYLNGIVGFHYLAMAEEHRPNGWSDDEIYGGRFHDPAPEEEDLRFYPFRVSQPNFTPDTSGDLIISAGSLGVLSSMEEADHPTNAFTDGCEGDCPLTKADVDTLVTWLGEFAKTRDTSKVAKVDIYLPTNLFIEENNEVFNYLFTNIRHLEQSNILASASQKTVYEAVVNQE